MAHINTIVIIILFLLNTALFIYVVHRIIISFAPSYQSDYTETFVVSYISERNSSIYSNEIKSFNLVKKDLQSTLNNNFTRDPASTTEIGNNADKLVSSSKNIRII